MCKNRGQCVQLFLNPTNPTVDKDYAKTERKKSRMVPCVVYDRETSFAISTKTGGPHLRFFHILDFAKPKGDSTGEYPPRVNIFSLVARLSLPLAGLAPVRKRRLRLT